MFWWNLQGEKSIAIKIFWQEEAGKRKVKRAEGEKEAKELLEKQLIEKAIKLKKKQISRMKVIEDLSDDEEPCQTKFDKLHSEYQNEPAKEKTKPIINKPQPLLIKKVDPYEAFRLKFKII